MGYSIFDELPLEPPVYKPWGYCECCGEPIYYNEDYFDVDGVVYCMECVRRRTAGDDE